MKRLALSSLFVLAACGIDLGGLGQHGGATARRSAITCPKSPAPQTFGQAVCLCRDLDLVGQGVLARAGQGGPAKVGINGKMDVVGQHQVDGELQVDGEISGVGDLTVNGEALCRGNVDGVGHLNVTQDLSVGGDLSSVGQLDVGGALKVKGKVDNVGQQQVASLGAYADPSGPACDCANPALPDVAAAIAQAKAANDDAAAGLPESIDSVGDASFHLPSGVYYLASVSSVGQLTFFIEGAVALHVDGDLDAVGDLKFAIADGATLDLYVAGQLSHVGQSLLGDAQHLGAVRLYLGSTGEVDLSVGDAEIDGLIYAPHASINVVGDTTVRGALFANDLNGVGRLTVEYSGVALPGAGVCANADGGTPDGTGTGGDADGGSGAGSGGGSGSDADAGTHGSCDAGNPGDVAPGLN